MFFFSKEQTDFQARIRNFAQKELTEGALDRWRLEHVPEEILKKLADMGIFSMTTPEKFGGQPKDCVSIGTTFEEICAVDFAPMSSLLSHVLVPMMMIHSSNELQEEWMPAFAAGDKLASFGNTEPDCGSDAAAIKTVAVKDGDSYVVTGEKTSISAGMQADAMIFTARTNPEAGIKGITCFLVPLDVPGVSRSGFRDLGHSASGRASIILSEVRIPKRNQIGEEGEGFTRILSGFDFARALVILAGAGMVRSALSEAIEFSKKRVAFDHSISRYQGVSFKLSECATLLEATRLLCYQALSLRDQNKSHGIESAMSKWYGADNLVRVMRELIQLAGWKGFREQSSFQQRLRDVIGLCIGDGTSEIMKMIIARDLVGYKFGPKF